MLTKRRRDAVIRDWRRRHQPSGGPDLGDLIIPETSRVRAGRHRAPTPVMPLSGQALAQYPTRWVGLGGTVLCILAWIALGVAPMFKVVTAQVAGTQRLAVETVLSQAAVVGQSAFRIEPDEVVARLSTLPDIEQASVSVALPRTVVIRVRETAPVLEWRSGGTAFAIDVHARAIPMPPDVTNLPIVNDRTNQVKAVGDRLPPGLVGAATAYADAFGELTLEPGHGFTARTAEGWPVWLGVDGRRSGEQAAMLDGLRAGSLKGSSDLAYIDLRPTARPYFRLRGGE